VLGIEVGSSAVLGSAVLVDVCEWNCVVTLVTIEDTLELVMVDVDSAVIADSTGLVFSVVVVVEMVSVVVVIAVVLPEAVAEDEELVAMGSQTQIELR
jgi:hypothetical protein